MAATLQRIHVEGARRRIRGASPRYLPTAEELSSSSAMPDRRNRKLLSSPSHR